MTQVVRAGAWSVSSKGQGILQLTLIPTSELSLCADTGTKLGTSFLACVPLTHNNLFSQVATLNALKLSVALAPWMVMAWPPLSCCEDSLDSPSQCWACGRAADGTWGAVCV